MELIDVIKLMENLKGLGISIKSTVVLKHLLSIPRLASCIQHITLERVISKDGPLQLETAMASLRSIEIQGENGWRILKGPADIRSNHTSPKSGNRSSIDRKEPCYPTNSCNEQKAEREASLNTSANLYFSTRECVSTFKEGNNFTDHKINI
ncbi:hypothetical protein YC2023_100458 [Brassica napus]